MFHRTGLERTSVSKLLLVSLKYWRRLSFADLIEVFDAGVVEVLPSPLVGVAAAWAGVVLEGGNDGAARAPPP